MNFTKLIDQPLQIEETGGTTSLNQKKFILSFANDFEEGSWRSSNFQNFIWDNIALTALSKKERDSLANKSHTALVNAAKNLRLTDSVSDIGSGSELAEILLYGIMEHHYGALPVVPKIFYKQNPQDNAKGADSVHITLIGTDDFAIWFGESKFYNSLQDSRLPSIIASVEEMLGPDKLKKENSIICNISDLDELSIDSTQLALIKSMLSNQNTLDNLKPKLHIPILLLHECEITSKCNSWSNSYRDALTAHHLERSKKYFSKQLSSLGKKIFNYSEITFHVILFPVPSKDDIVKNFITVAKQYKEK
jgi:hypothetical protein